MKKKPDILSPTQFGMMFPHAVPGAIKKNREQWERHNPPTPCASAPASPPVPRRAQGAPRQRKGMNKTEAAFFELLKVRREQGEFDSVEREGVTFRWPDGMRYTPDFVGWKEGRKPVAFETKGPYIHPKDLTKYRAAKHAWPWFIFEMHQRDRDGKWSKIL